MPDTQRELALDANAADQVDPRQSSTFQLKPYVPDRQRDWVRTIVTVGLLGALGGIIFWACRQSVSSDTQWAQTKEMLQIILPAITALLGSVIGFYFGTGSTFNSKNRDS